MLAAIAMVVEVLPLSLLLVAGPGAAAGGPEFTQTWERPYAEAYVLRQDFGIPYDVAGDANGNIYVLGVSLQGQAWQPTISKLGPSSYTVANWVFGYGTGQNQLGLNYALSVGTFTDGDGQTTVYVLDAMSCRIVRLSDSGSWLGTFGQCGTGSGQFRSAGEIHGFAVSPTTGDVYVGDSTREILRFNSTGAFLNEWARPDNPYATNPNDVRGRVQGLAVDASNGHVWATIDSQTPSQFGIVVEFTSGGSQLQWWPSHPLSCSGVSSEGQDTEAIGELLASNGELIVTTNRYYAPLVRYASNGTCIQPLAVPSFSRLQGQQDFATGEAEVSAPWAGVQLGWGADGHILAMHGSTPRLIEMTVSGAHVRTILGQTFGYGFGPLVADSHDGRVYFSDRGLLRRYDYSSLWLGYWTQNGHAGGYGFGRPSATDSSGDVYLSLAIPNRGGMIRVFTLDGSVVKEFGTPCAPGTARVCTGSLGELNDPYDAAVDSSGNIYAMEYNYVTGGRITKYNASGSALWCIGQGSACTVNNRQLNVGQAQVAIGPDGMLYIAEPDTAKVYIFNATDGSDVANFGVPVGPYQLGFRQNPDYGWTLYTVSYTPNLNLHRYSLRGADRGTALTLPLNGFTDFSLDSDGVLFVTGQSRLIRFDPVVTNRPPTSLVVAVTPACEGEATLFNATAVDPDGNALTYSFDFNLDGTTDATSTTGLASHVWGDDFSGNVTVSATDGTFTINTSVPVSVCNTPPHVVAVANSTVEGSPLQVNYTVTDPGSDDLTVTVDWPDGAPSVTSYQLGSSPDAAGSVDLNPRNVSGTANHTFGDNTDFVWTLTAKDDDGGVATAQFRVLVVNGQPTLTVPFAVEGVEGSPISVGISATDPGSDDLAVNWSWGDARNTTHMFYNNNASADPANSTGGTYPMSVNDTATHTYGDDGTYTLVVNVSDDDGASVQASIEVHIANAAPSIQLFSAGSSFVEGDAVESTGVFVDAGSDDVTLNWQWSAGPGGATTWLNSGVPDTTPCSAASGVPDTVPTLIDSGVPDTIPSTVGSGVPDTHPSPGGASPFCGAALFRHTYGDNGERTLTVKACDDDGGCSVAEATFNIVNEAPALSATADGLANEGDRVSASAHFTDPGFNDTAAGTSETFLTWVEWGDGSSDVLSPSVTQGNAGNATAGSFAGEHRYGDDGVFSIRFAACDDDGGCTYETRHVNVTNVDPVVNLTGPSGGTVIRVNTTLNLTGTFTDAGRFDTHTALWKIGNESFDGTVAEWMGNGSVADNYTFADPGVFRIELKVCDDDGGCGASDSVAGVIAYVVVYDPEGGFVTGSGWIASPAGAYGADHNITGKASFGFVSKYQKGKTVPAGATEFQFKAGAFSFKSTDYQWLVVSGARAQFKGNGTVSGVSGFGFLLTAVDGQQQGGGGTDLFRIKVWDRSTGTVVYDNQRGDSDDAALSTALGGGSIQIQKS